MLKVYIGIILLIFLQACTHKTTKPKVKIKVAFQAAYDIHTSFGFSNDTILIGYGKGTEGDLSNWPVSGLYKSASDSFYKDGKFNSGSTLDDKAFTETMKLKPVYIQDIYTNRFKYDLIAEDYNIFSPTGGTAKDSFNIYMPGGGAIADIILNKPARESDTASAIYKFAKRNNVRALKTYKNYWVYLTCDSTYRTFLNILNTETNQDCIIPTDGLVGPANFLLYDVMNDEKPEIILFQTPAYLFKFSGSLKVFRIVD
jgi:hypothetical protein